MSSAPPAPVTKKVVWGKKTTTVTVLDGPPKSSGPSTAVVIPPPPVVPKQAPNNTAKDIPGPPQIQYVSEIQTNQDRTMCLDMDLPSISTMAPSENTSQRVLASAEKPPDRVVDSYIDDYNILELDDIIQKRFTYNRKVLLEELNRKLAIEKVNLSRPGTVVERKAINAAIKSLNDSIDAITSDRDLLKYQKESREILEHYRNIGIKKKIISFKMAPRESKKDEDDEFRHHIIARYLDIARKYIQLDITREIPYNNNCPNCNSHLEEVAIDDETIMMCCSECDYQVHNIARTVSSTDVIKPAGGGYDDQENFLKALRRYQGKQQNHLPDTLYQELDNYFISYDLPTSEEVMSAPLNEKGTRGNVTKELMYRALFAIKRMAYYEDVPLITHLYWGFTLPDVSHLEDKILDDYSKTQRIYETLIKQRKSNLNISFRLFKHLQLRGHKCSIEDFKMVKTRDILEYHDMMWKQIMDKAQLLYPDEGFRFIPTV